jgi:hypothetical protein
MPFNVALTKRSERELARGGSFWWSGFVPIARCAGGTSRERSERHIPARTARRNKLLVSFLSIIMV